MLEEESLTDPCREKVVELLIEGALLELALGVVVGVGGEVEKCRTNVVRHRVKWRRRFADELGEARLVVGGERFWVPNDAHDEARVDGGGFLNARIVAEAKGKEL